MIPIEKVQQIVNTYETLEKELASGNVDKKDFVKKSKEYSSISEIINEAKGYLDLEKEKEELLNWNLTAKTIKHVDDWKKFFEKINFKGDFYWFKTSNFKF